MKTWLIYAAYKLNINVFSLLFWHSCNNEDDWSPGSCSEAGYSRGLDHYVQRCSIHLGLSNSVPKHRKLCTGQSNEWVWSDGTDLKWYSPWHEGCATSATTKWAYMCVERSDKGNPTWMPTDGKRNYKCVCKKHHHGTGYVSWSTNVVTISAAAIAIVVLIIVVAIIGTVIYCRRYG